MVENHTRVSDKRSQNDHKEQAWKNSRVELFILVERPNLVDERI